MALVSSPEMRCLTHHLKRIIWSSTHKTQRAELSVMDPRSYIHVKRYMVMTSKQHGICLLLRKFKATTGPVRYRYREVG